MAEKLSDIQELPGVVHEHKNRLYPIFLKLDQLETLLVGAGNVGLENCNHYFQIPPKQKLQWSHWR
jgi:hypothetical protein